MKIETQFDIGDAVEEIPSGTRIPVSGFIVEIKVSGGKYTKRGISIGYVVRVNDGRYRTLSQFEIRRVPTVNGQPVPR